MTMIFEIEHHCDEIPVVKIKILEKTCWQKKPSWQTKDNVNRSTIFEPFVLSFMDMLERPTFEENLPAATFGNAFFI